MHSVAAPSNQLNVMKSVTIWTHLFWHEWFKWLFRFVLCNEVNFSRAHSDLTVNFFFRDFVMLKLFLLSQFILISTWKNCIFTRKITQNEDARLIVEQTTKIWWMSQLITILLPHIFVFRIIEAKAHIDYFINLHMLQVDSNVPLINWGRWNNSERIVA